jgi:hypothetical protein
MAFFTREILTTIVVESITYAQLCLGEKFETWEKITVEELMAYFLFMILMGLVKLPALADYWSTNETFAYQPISKRISRARFYDILHFVNNEAHYQHMEQQDIVSCRKSIQF